MRLGAFVFGGLVGAAATMYMARRRPEAVAIVSGAVKGMCSAVAAKTIKTMSGIDLKQQKMREIPKSTDDTATHSSAKQTLETLIQSDPSLKREADKIMAESSSLPH